MNVIVELKTLKFYAYHGLLAQEQKVGNFFTVDIRCSFESDPSLMSRDVLESTIDYSVLYEVVRGEMVISSKLIEHVAFRIIHAVKRTFPKIASVVVCVTKLAPPMAGEMAGAAVTLEERWDR